MGKAEETTAIVARRLLDIPSGERIPTTADLAGAAQVGFGTVQAALRALREAGVIRLSTHGHQGSRLVERDLVPLWKASGRGALVGVLPLPQSIEFSGLATAITLECEAAGLQIQLAFRQGGRHRLELLDEGRTDFVCVSAAAARNLGSQGYRCLQLPAHTFYSDRSVVVITASGRPVPENGFVPIDRGSYDHCLLTEAEFPSASYVDTPYFRIPELVVAGRFEAAVWHQGSSSPLFTAAGLDLHPLRRPSAADSDEMSRAAIVWRADAPGITTLVEEIFDGSALAMTQRRVILGEIEPRF